MSAIIGILIGLVFIFLIGKAILETIWGIGIIIHGLFWHAVGYSLTGLAMTLRAFARLRKVAH